MEIFKLMGSILINSDEADKSLSKTDKNAQGVAKSLTGGIGTAAKWGIGLAVAAAGAVTGLVEVALKAGDTAKEIEDMSAKTNISTEHLQEYKYAAEQTGVSMDSIESAAKKLTVTMFNSEHGNKTATAAFKELGVSTLDAGGHLKTTDEMFPDIITHLAGMSDITERNGLMTKIFGKSAMDMAPLLNQGAAGVKELTDKAHSLGLVLSDEDIKAGAKFHESMLTMKASLDALTTKIGISVMPVLQAMIDWVMAHLPQIQAVFSAAFKIIGTIVKAVGDFITNVLIPTFNNLWNWIQPHMPEIQKIVSEVMTVVKDVMKGVSDFITNVLIPIYKSMADWFMKNFPVIKQAVMDAYNYIKPSFDNLVKVVKEDLIPIIQDLWKKVQAAMPTIQGIFEVVGPAIVVAIKLALDIIATFIKVAKGIYDLISPALNLIIGVFNDITKAIKFAYDALCSWNNTNMDNKTGSVTLNSYTNQLTGKNAKGTDFWEGGPTWVGEQGPEILNLPRGSQIIPNNKIGNAGGKSQTINYYGPVYMRDDSENNNNQAQMQFLAAI